MSLKHKLISFFFLATGVPCLGQEGSRNFLFNKGQVTIVDDLRKGGFSISFKGDTIQSMEHAGLYMIDSVMIQVSKFKIPQRMGDWKYQPADERKLLDYFADYEFHYQKDTVYAMKLSSRREFFSNRFGKQFQLWHYDLPREWVEKESKKEDVDSASTVYNVASQVFMSFITGEYVTMVNIPVFLGEDKLAKHKYLKGFVANSVRIYEGEISLNALSNQINHHLNGTPFRVTDSTLHFSFVVPEWLNISKQEKYPLMGVFPDQFNISNAMVLAYFDKDRFSSFDDFAARMLQNPGVSSYKRLASGEKKMRRYQVRYVTNEGYSFECQHVYLDFGVSYGIINFTATDKTYKLNIDRFNDFVASIRFF